jgi:ADP-heptose:LPS heptosyltransferase
MALNKTAHVGGNDHGYRTVVAARFSAIGDVAIALPVIYSACHAYADVNFVFVTRPSMASFFINRPANLTVVGVDVKADEYRGVGGMRRLVNELTAQYHPDVFLDLHDVLRTRLMGLFFRLKGIGTFRIKKYRRQRRRLTRSRAKVMLPMPSATDRYTEVFYHAQMPLDDTFDGLFGANKRGDETAFSVITAPKAAGCRWVGIAPYAAHLGKVYPITRMEQVVKRLSQHPDIHIFLFGGGGDEKLTLEAWERLYPNVTSLSGKKYGFPTELALLSHLDVMVSMDSANMHLASLVNTRVISVWGATHPYCGFLGRHQDGGDVIQTALRCRPCSVFGQKPCRYEDYRCLTTISESTIYNKIIEALQPR